MEKDGLLNKEQAEARLSQLKKTLMHEDVAESDGFVVQGKGRGKVLARIASEYARQGYSMGAPNAITKNAMQIPWNQEVIDALMEAEMLYSTNSVTGKKGERMETSRAGIEIMSKFRPFTDLFNLVDKNRTASGKPDFARIMEA